MLVDKNGKPLDENGYRAVKELLLNWAHGQFYLLNQTIRNKQTVLEPRRYRFMLALYMLNESRSDISDIIKECQNDKNKISVSKFFAQAKEQLKQRAINSYLEIEQDYCTDEEKKKVISDTEEYVKINSGESYQISNSVDVSDKFSDDLNRLLGNSRNTFQLTNTPFEGIEELSDRPISEEIEDVLFNGRERHHWTREGKNVAGIDRSDYITLPDAKEKLEELQKDPQAEEKAKQYQKLVSQLEAREEKLKAGMEKAEGHAKILRGKTAVTPADLYTVIKDIHATVTGKSGNKSYQLLRSYRTSHQTEPSLSEDEGAGKLYRTCGPTVSPMLLWEVLEKLAEDINTVKNTTGEALQKSRAIQVAAEAYQLLYSMYAFRGADGRTSRLMADVILQMFHLPPHTPSWETQQLLCDEIGKPLDFTRGAREFMKCCQESNRILLLDKLKVWQEGAKKAKGKYRDSDEWKAFDAALNDCLVLAEALNRQREQTIYTVNYGWRKEIETEINTEMLEYAYAAAVKNVKRTADAYVDYKCKTLGRTDRDVNFLSLDATREDDQEKLKIIRDILQDNQITKKSLPGNGKTDFLPTRTKEFKGPNSSCTTLTPSSEQQKLQDIRGKVAAATSFWKNSPEWKDLVAALDECRRLANELPTEFKPGIVKEAHQKYIIASVKLQVMAQRYRQAKAKEKEEKGELSPQTKNKLQIVGQILGTTSKVVMDVTGKGAASKNPVNFIGGNENLVSASSSTKRITSLCNKK